MHEIEGPIANDRSLPYGSAMANREQARLLDEYDYVEEEFFVSGTAALYGPTTNEPLEEYEQAERREAAVDAV